LSWIEFEASVLGVKSVAPLRLFRRGRIQSNNVYDIKVTLKKRVAVGNPHEGGSSELPQMCLGKGRYYGDLLDPRVCPLQPPGLEVIKPFEGIERVVRRAVG